MAILIQLLKAVHQVALDQGSWHAGQHLLVHRDSMATCDFGGDPTEIEAIHSFTKALGELTKAHQVSQAGDSEGNAGGGGYGGNNMSAKAKAAAAKKAAAAAAAAAAAG